MIMISVDSSRPLRSCFSVGIILIVELFAVPLLVTPYAFSARSHLAIKHIAQLLEDCYNAAFDFATDAHIHSQRATRDLKFQMSCRY